MVEGLLGAEIDGGVLLLGGEVDVLVEHVAQRLQVLRDAVVDLARRLEPGEQGDGGAAEHVAARLAALRDVAAELEGLEDVVDAALEQAAVRRELRDACVGVILVEVVEQVQGLVEGFYFRGGFRGHDTFLSLRKRFLAVAFPKIIFIIDELARKGKCPRSAKFFFGFYNEPRVRPL